jgi:hypothetical protein
VQHQTRRWQTSRELFHVEQPLWGRLSYKDFHIDGL